MQRLIFSKTPMGLGLLIDFKPPYASSIEPLFSLQIDLLFIRYWLRIN